MRDFLVFCAKPAFLIFFFWIPWTTKISFWQLILSISKWISVYFKHFTANMGNRKNDYEKKTTTKLLGIFCVEKEFFKNFKKSWPRRKSNLNCTIVYTCLVKPGAIYKCMSKKKKTTNQLHFEWNNIASYSGTACMIMQWTFKCSKHQ